MGFFDNLFGKKEKPFKDHGKGHEHCNFGVKEFNKTKRSKEFIEEIAVNRGKGKNKTTTTTTTQAPTSSTTSTTTASSSSDFIVFLDFDGSIVRNTSWNVSGDIVADYSGLTEYEQEQIVDNANYDYTKFNVTFTKDEAVFLATPMNKRMRCIITESWEWYCGSSPCAGGVAYVGSAGWANDTPCWVFSSALGYSVKNIQEAVSHEVGHTFGLRHQALWDGSCNLISSYNQGCCGEAPIMGVGYYQPDVHWWVGPTNLGCNSIQDDEAILKSKVGIRS